MCSWQLVSGDSCWAIPEWSDTGCRMSALARFFSRSACLCGPFWYSNATIGLPRGREVADLLNMSEATALGLHAAVFLAEQRIAASTPQIARALCASEAHVSKVLQRLVRAELFASRRGPNGGYTLAKPPREVTLLDVYQALEGPMRRGGCLFLKATCNRQACILGSLVEDVRQDVFDRFRSTTLSDLVDATRR